MKIDSIKINNFRQYRETYSIDLRTDERKNIVLIGGLNGYGKTNFLMALVWCFYGEDIAKIDDNFKKEIQKFGNYAKFLKGTLNRDALEIGEDVFSVEIELSDIELPNTIEIKSATNYKCKLKRSFETNSANENFDITIDSLKISQFNDSDSKKEFVNDYLVPVEAAKFVFFDAEKIASWAELSTKEEGSVLNDALGKILGLDIYENLINDFENYTDDLRKESATPSLKQQITAIQNGIEINNEKILVNDIELDKKETAISNLKNKIIKYQNYIAKHSNMDLSQVNLKEIYKNKIDLETKQKEIENNFNLLSEIIPFAIAGGKLEEVIEHISKQSQNADLKEKDSVISEKNNLLLEKLFNNPPFPNEGDISFSKKMFYADKAKNIIEELFGKNGDEIDLDFEHDLNKMDTELINVTYNYLRKQSKDIFEETIDNFNRIKNDLSEISRLIKRAETQQEDEDVIKYTNNKNDAERNIEKLIEEKGALQNQLSLIKKNIITDTQRMHILIKKIDVSELKKKKLDKANQYIKTLRNFVDEQKRNKCNALENAILEAMQKIMHKLQNDTNDKFVVAVKVETLPDNDGLKITLLDKDGLIISKESLSQGEKQIYISSLIKAILSLSIQEFPIFIDTPVGRLDNEHINNILLYYYPNLSSQVVIMATNNEIPNYRYKLIEQHVAKTYLLENKNNKTTVIKGYF